MRGVAKFERAALEIKHGEEWGAIATVDARAGLARKAAARDAEGRGSGNRSTNWNTPLKSIQDGPRSVTLRLLGTECVSFMHERYEAKPRCNVCLFYSFSGCFLGWLMEAAQLHVNGMIWLCILRRCCY